MRRKIIAGLIVIAIVVVSIAISYSLINSRPIPPVNVPAELTINVKEYNTKNQAYVVDIEYPARVYAKNIVKLGVQVSGQILSGDVPLKTGQAFKKGDLLVNIYDKDILANLKAQKSQFLNVLAKALPDIMVDFPEQAPKWTKFFEDISLDEPLPKFPEIETTKEKVYLSVKGVISNYYSIEQMEIVLDRYKFYAPFNGVFTEVTKEVGAMASMGGDIGTITSTDNLELVIGISPIEAKLLEINKKASIISPTGITYSAKIVRISSQVDQRTQRVMVYMELSEPSQDIIAGQMVDVKITLNELENVIRIPREILNKDNQIYKIENSKLYPIDIDILLTIGKYSYIRGLEDNVSIIYESLVEPKTGTKINVIETVQNS